ncbi:hypothetical protein LJ737_10375 [Hymenobacter sp. 15J16-1T3B]|uniref:hypothetical protein n=1 Tax=Hymenobacter sp. 15J16-1T3B TaxID=2886941 RepID=UPI001D0FAF6D|nr:hypothetical protein [Hymenobacter sp. 15J16-1T3B]MCC3157646.1 hypothetical protein [Hymenobacter sp. 15J16-1T3B]
MRPALLPLMLLPGSLLLAMSAAAQRSPSAAAAAGPQPVQAPAPPPALDDPTAPIRTEPSPAMQRLYAQQRVRAVVKLRLTEDGQARDTAEYREIDGQGRLTLLRRYGSGWQERREWSYDDAGHCTSMVIHAVPGRSFTTVYTFNPALGRGRCEVLHANGRRTTVCELQRRTLGDTLLTEARFWALTVGRYHFPPNGYSRNWRFSLGADTVLTLLSTYTPKGRTQSTKLQYERLYQGQLQEAGLVDVRQALRTYRQLSARTLPAEQVPFRQLPALLRANPEESFRPTARYSYDARQRLTEQQLITSWNYAHGPGYTTLVSNNVRTSLNHSPSASRSVALGQASVCSIITNTYNDLDQLIGQQRRLIGTRYPNQPTYLVLSYQPDGLPAAETNRTTAQPVFYRYQYQYYE